jgi:predicted N-formylglutamate amidohydrolase
MGNSRSGISAKPFRITNRNGRSPVVLVCDHASNFIPDEFAGLGLAAADLDGHIAWDPGALPVCQDIAAALDAAVIESCVSRLVVDCNRPLDAPDLICPISETTPIPGNARLSAEERARRIELVYEPYHGALEAVVAERLRDRRETWLVAIHSFTPFYKGVARPWHIGVIHDDDERMARPLISALAGIKGVEVGDNVPYSPADRVYFTMERHARMRGIPCVMIEIRNDELSTTAGCSLWADRIAETLAAMNLARGVRHDSGPMEADIA